MDAHMTKLRKIGQDSRHAGCGEVYASMLRVKHAMEEERRQFQEAVMHTKLCQREAVGRQRQLEQALIEVTEASKAAWLEADRRERENEEKLKEAGQTLAQVCMLPTSEPKETHKTTIIETQPYSVGSNRGIYKPE